MTKECIICDKEFAVLKHNSCLCSDECKKIRKREVARCYGKKEEVRIKNKNRMEKYRRENEEKIAESGKLYRLNNKEKEKLRHKKYIEENRDSRNAYLNNKRKNDINYKIKKDIQKRINYALFSNRNMTKRGARILKIIGCSKQEFRDHIENQFDENMNWDNYNIYWNLDHIIPTSIYQLIDETELKKCFNYRNTRPCIVLENNKKKNKIDFILIDSYGTRDLMPNTEVQLNNIVTCISS